MSEIKKASCSISFETVNGYKSRAGSLHKPGVSALLWALDEIGRVMTVGGQTDAAREALEAAIRRTQSDLKEQGPGMSNSTTPKTEEREQFEPLPCPFCGTTDVITRLSESYRWGHAYCNGCGIVVGEVRTNGDESETAPWRKNALAEWNRRTAPDVRAMALKEAADIADEMILYAGCDIANALRALAAKKDET